MDLRQFRAAIHLRHAELTCKRQQSLVLLAFPQNHQPHRHGPAQFGKGAQ
jgi:hypothetical protein